ncbi:putative receptor-like protein kinase At5g39000 [Rutidosis leptorrhynchoides]|uniref:putative receptor-like protein kinase At5g39000 n=1 Tax=Rutidosis leptorrhynchoides TaxID=125765 RepID=UPI003A999CBD
MEVLTIQRLRICLDVARGIKYFHHDVEPQVSIIHRDIKSANILLGENWNAKVSDFGLARIAPVDMQTTFLISSPCGTHGYMDPDYYLHSYLTKETDVYSFGIVLFEILCGRPARVTTYEEKDYREFLQVLVRKHYESGTLEEIVHFAIRDQVNEASLLTFSNIAYQCLMSGHKRPTMKEVVINLQKALDIQRAADEYEYDTDHHQEQPRYTGFTFKLYSDKMMNTEVRLVQCPTCRKLLQEPSGLLLYECGGCGTKLQGSLIQQRSEKMIQMIPPEN